MLTTIMTIINICSLILIAVVFFRERYTIVDVETWNTIVNYYNEHVEAEEDAENNCGGGCGFFWDYVSDIEEDEQEEDE